MCVLDAISIMIGIVVGTGIYETPPLVFQNVSFPWLGLGAWALGGMLSLVGALCYAELASTYPRSGGEYVYLTRAYGPCLGFLFGWAQLAVIGSASIGMMAYVFGDYAARLCNSNTESASVFAVLAVAVLFGVNVLGIVFGRQTQNVLTAAKVLGLAGLVLAGLLWPSASGAETALPSSSTASLAAAMVLVLLTYGGWSDTACVAAELQGGRRSIVRALILGTVAIALIYLLVNCAYLWSLGFEGVRTSRAVAADVFQNAFGPAGAQGMCILVIVSALSAINGMIVTGSRVFASLGADHSALGWLGRWHPRRGAPLGSLATQAVLCVALIGLVGIEPVRSLIPALLNRLGWPVEGWQGQGGFETLLRCTAPVFWGFFLLTALAVFVLRRKDRDVPRPFTTPWYPVLPAVFCATCACMLCAAVEYAGSLALIGGLVLAAGLPLYWLSRRRATSRASDNPSGAW